MQRKASKTNHVLDLISGKEEEKEKVAKRKSVKIIDDETPLPNEPELSELIKNNLEEEVKKEPEIKKTTNKKTQVKKIKDEDSDKKDNKSAKTKNPDVGKGFVYVNVMEAVVKAELDRAVKEFDMCTCEHCMSDIMALTLTNLPSKYVVTNGQISPLLNYYSNKYSDMVKIELMKACNLVSRYPHHK